MTLLQVVIITYLVLYFSGNLAPRYVAHHESRRQRREFREYTDRLIIKAHDEAYPPKLSPQKGMRFICLVICSPFIIMLGSVVIRFLTS